MALTKIFILKQKTVFLALTYLLSTIYYLLFLSGCATAPLTRPPQVAGVPGIYHRIEKGQTLFRISKMYSVDIDELARINHILDATNIEAGRLIFIPNRQKPVPSASLAQSGEDFIWPVRGRVISNFGALSGNMINRGINIQPYVNREIVASRSGRVVFCSPSFFNYGKTLVIEHHDGFFSVYARNSEVFIKVGDRVKRGALIARVGSAGRDKNEYLHFEIRKGHIPKNPIFYLP